MSIRVNEAAVCLDRQGMLGGAAQGYGCRTMSVLAHVWKDGEAETEPGAGLGS